LGSFCSRFLRRRPEDQHVVDQDYLEGDGKSLACKTRRRNTVMMGRPVTEIAHAVESRNLQKFVSSQSS
jgi:hypothetical protein